MTDYCPRCQCEPCLCVGKPSKMSQARMKAMNSEEGVLYKEIWNDAIDAAADVADLEIGIEIRKLKK